jgi:hypothetical protein
LSGTLAFQGVVMLLAWTSLSFLGGLDYIIRLFGALKIALTPWNQPAGCSLADGILPGLLLVLVIAVWSAVLQLHLAGCVGCLKLPLMMFHTAYGTMLCHPGDHFAQVCRCRSSNRHNPAGCKKQ